jgi:hypothetical protein
MRSIGSSRLCDYQRFVDNDAMIVILFFFIGDSKVGSSSGARGFRGKSTEHYSGNDDEL